MWEWTTETGKPDGGATRAVRRGGSFWYDGAGLPVSYRGGGSETTWYDVDVGFRVVLYIK